MELVPAALETRCLILLPAAPGLAPAVLDYYLRNAAFLAPFEPERPAGFYTAEHHARELAADVQRAAQGTGVRFYLALKDVPGRVIGSVALNNIVRGAFQSCFLGYKLDGALCGRGYMTQAVEACTRFAFGPAALHRVEANVMPRNTASLRVLEKCGYRPEGLARRYRRTKRPVARVRPHPYGASQRAGQGLTSRVQYRRTRQSAGVPGARSYWNSVRSSRSNTESSSRKSSTNG